MKAYNKILLAGLVTASVLSSCKDDDFLKEEPKTIYTVETAFEKSSQVDAAIARAYISFNYMFGWHNLYVEGAAASNLLGGNGSDCIDSGFGDPAMAAGFLSNYMNLNSNTGDFNTLWNELYQLAAQANLALYGSELVNWADANEKNYAVAQARFFRGWAYLRLGECFGGVPIVEEYSDELRFDYQRNTRQETYAFAIADLEAAASALPAYPRQDGRAGQGIANHYLAEAYLAQGVETGDKSYYNKAISAAQKVIAAHPLMTSRFGVRANPADTGTSGYLNVPNYKADGNVYYDLFQMGNYNYSAGNTESLMAVQGPTYDQWANDGGNVYMYGVTVGAVYRDLIWNTAEGQPDSAGPWHDNPNIDMGQWVGGNSGAYLGGTSWGLIGTTDYSDEVVWEGQFDDDLRNSQIVRCNPIVLEKTSKHYGEICKKEWLNIPSRLMRVSCKIAMQDGWGWDVHHAFAGVQTFAYQYGRDLYVARSAETYLLLAEAYLRNGDMTNAVAALNTVRQRAQASYMYSTITIRDILDERARELAYEEHRWPTLLRLDSSTGTNEDMKYQLSHYTMYTNDCGLDGITPKWTLFPIPLTVINLNSEVELAQNPGWN
ncbi:MAG: RagB/SusD family nutrient uptake outer membrane protein [Bacteroidaceae bacterium]|nr:RagB/SusD family nutrient uptake outer membrane protein [Bacteroidaceae bacterium]